jgi:hypothetical protein
MVEFNYCTVGYPSRRLNDGQPGSARQSISSRLPSSTPRVNSVALTPPPVTMSTFISRKVGNILIFTYSSGWQQFQGPVSSFKGGTFPVQVAIRLIR